MIECVHRECRIVIDDNGNQGVILNFFDADGDDCEPEEAVACVAECAGKFWAINLREYENAINN